MLVPRSQWLTCVASPPRPRRTAARTCMSNSLRSMACPEPCCLFVEERRQDAAAGRSRCQTEACAWSGTCAPRANAQRSPPTRVKRVRLGLDRCRLLAPGPQGEPVGDDLAEAIVLGPVAGQNRAAHQHGGGGMRVRRGGGHGAPDIVGRVGKSAVASGAHRPASAVVTRRAVRLWARDAGMDDLYVNDCSREA